MGLKDEFNAGKPCGAFYKRGDDILDWVTGHSHSLHYNFAARVLVVSDYNKGGVSVTPFSQLDWESLEVMRDKLIELGGKPPTLPPVPEEKFPTMRLDK